MLLLPHDLYLLQLFEILLSNSLGLADVVVNSGPIVGRGATVSLHPHPPAGCMEYVHVRAVATGGWHGLALRSSTPGN